MNADEQDRQDRQDEVTLQPASSISEFRHEEVTKHVIGSAFEVINELGAGFVESVYEHALLIALRQRGLNAHSQQRIAVMFRGERVGDFFADIVVNGVVIVELKAVKALVAEHHAQILNYLHATGIQVGLLINFGNPKLEYKRFTTTKVSSRQAHPVHPDNPR